MGFQSMGFRSNGTTLLCWLAVSLSKRPINMFLLFPPTGLLRQKRIMSQPWPQLQEALKSCGSCSSCNVVRRHHLKDDTVHLHDPHNNRCPGSLKPPLGGVANAGASNNSSNSHPPASVTISQPLPFTSEDNSHPTHSISTSTQLISHPQTGKTYYQTHPQIGKVILRSTAGGCP